MAMAYVNLLAKYSVIISCLAAIGCGNATMPTISPGTSGKEAAASPPKSELLATLQYIPQPKVDKKGKVKAYKQKANPYLRSRSSVKKETIDTFIAARRAYQKNNFTAAQELLEKISNEDAKLSGPWVLLGDIALEQKDFKIAQEHFLQASAINKKNVNAYLRLAKVQRMQGDFVGSQNTYAYVLSIWKDFPEAHLNLGVLYDIYLNDDIKAQKHMEAYQFLTGGKNAEVENWLFEIKKRTGMATGLNISQPSKPLS
jgi:tetratricopeptide (TPR) repeat protein